MIELGYTLMGEQAGPKQLVRDAVRAEEVGFDFLAASDHFNPWLAEQGHSPYAWSVLGAVAQATERIDLMTYVTCPTMRYHPAIVAQKAATIQQLSDGRFTLGLGAGERLNEHVTGASWPSVDVRHEMLDDAVQIIRPLLAGETLTYRGKHLSTQGAKLWDAPSSPPAIGIAVSGPESAALAGGLADVMIAVDAQAELGTLFEEAGGTGKPRVGQIAVCYDKDEAAARKRALEQFRWFTGGWPVNAELPGTTHFDAAAKSVREEDVIEKVPCGSDVDACVQAVAKFQDAGFTAVAIVQVGGESQEPFLDWSQKALLPALRHSLT